MDAPSSKVEIKAGVCKACVSVGPYIQSMQRLRLTVCV